MWHLSDCAACCRLQEGWRWSSQDIIRLFTLMRWVAADNVRVRNKGRDRQRAAKEWGSRGRRGKGKATYAARTCQKTFWKPSIGRNNNDRWQSTGGRWEQKRRENERENERERKRERVGGRQHTHVHAPCYMLHARGSVSNWLSHQVVDMYGKSFAPAFLHHLPPPLPPMIWAGQFPEGAYL